MGRFTTFTFVADEQHFNIRHSYATVDTTVSRDQFYVNDICHAGCSYYASETDMSWKSKLQNPSGVLL